MESLSRDLERRLPNPRRALALTLVAVSILLGLCLSPLSHSNALPASAAREPQQESTRVEVMESDGQGITVEVTVPAVFEQQVQRQSTTYQRLSLQDAGTSGEIGEPELPHFGRFVAIPRGAQVQVQVLADTAEIKTGYLLYPAQEPRVERGQEPSVTLNLVELLDVLPRNLNALLHKRD
jgi:hypothetical protein